MAIAYSRCADTSSGLYTSNSGWPLLTGWPVAFTNSCSTQPSNLGAMANTRRSSTSMRPTALMTLSSERIAAGSLRTPSFCTLSTLILIWLLPVSGSSPA